MSQYHSATTGTPLPPAESHPLLIIVPFNSRDLVDLRKKALAVLAEPLRDARTPQRELEYYAGRAAAAQIARELKFDAKVTVDPELGYPRWEGPRHSGYLNISHTRGVAVAAWAPTPIGVDVELKTRDASYAVSRFRSPEEAVEPGEFGFGRKHGIPVDLALWSGKEAFAKATGLGMRQGMSDFHLNLRGEGPRYPARTLLETPLTLEHPALWYGTHRRFLLAVCTEAAVLERGVTCRVRRRDF